MQYLLDTNICIYIIKEKPVQVLSKFRQMPLNAMSISAITLAELEFGVAKSSLPEQNRQALRKFLLPILVLPFDDAAAVQYGIVRADLAKKGKTIGPLDMLLAAHALSLNITMVTNNEEEFRRVAGLKLENWVA